jgi:hypothetical protein
MEQLQKDIMHESMIKDFYKVVEKYFPNFFYMDDIEESTRAFLTLFTEETIHQLGKGKK